MKTAMESQERERKHRTTYPVIYSLLLHSYSDIKNVLHINPSKVRCPCVYKLHVSYYMTTLQKGNDPLLKIADEFSMQQPQSATIATAEDDDDVMDLLDSTS